MLPSVQATQSEREMVNCPEGNIFEARIPVVNLINEVYHNLFIILPVSTSLAITNKPTTGLTIKIKINFVIMVIA